jgi:hypothetical protein
MSAKAFFGAHPLSLEEVASIAVGRATVIVEEAAASKVGFPAASRLTRTTDPSTRVRVHCTRAASLHSQVVPRALTHTLSRRSRPRARRCPR